MPARRVTVLVGSIRREAFSRRLATALKLLEPPSLNLEIAEISGLPLYNPDLEAEIPFPWAEFRDTIRGSDAILFVTPEYNRGIPGALKNAIDVGSRPYGKSAWEGKPCGVVSSSTGAIGGFGANHAIRQCCVFLDMPVMPQPELYVGAVDKLVGADGNVQNDKTRQLFEKYLQTFARWIEVNMRAP